MALKTSLIITGDAASATAALDSLDKGMGEASAEAKKLEKAFADADKAIEQLAAAQTRAKQETLAAKVALQSGSISQQDYNARLLETKTALSLVESGHRGAVSALKQAQGAIGGAVSSTRAAQAGYVNLGRQVQDVAVQMQSGTNLGTIIAQQGGQIADAVAQMGGRFAGLASFLSGPFGSVLIVATGLLVNLGIEMFNSGDEAEESGKKTLSLADALDKSRFATEDARKALADYNAEQDRARKNTDAMIKLNLASAEARLKETIATREQIKARLELVPFEENPNDPLAQQNIGARDIYQSRIAEQDAKIKEARETARNLRIQDAVRDAGAAADPIKKINNRYDDMAEAAKRAAAGNDALSRSLKGTLSNIEIRRAADIKAQQDSQRASNRRRPADQTARRAEFSEDTAKRIANIADQFSDLPSTVTRANKAMRELDDISSDLAARPLAPNVKELIAEVGRAKSTIEESLNRPFEDFLQQSREAAEIDKLLLAGRDDEARALKIILDLKQKQGPLNRDQMNTVLATVQAERERAMVLRDQGELIAANVNAVRNFRGALEQTVADMFRGKFSLGRLLSSIGNSYINIMSQKIVEAMFGDTLRKLEAQATGADKVDAAGTRIAGSLDKGASAVETFADRMIQATSKIEGGSAADGGGAISDVLGKVGDSISGTFDKLLSGVMDKVAQKSGGNGVPESTGPEIVVTAEKSKKVDLSGTGAMLINMVDQTLRQLNIRLPKILLDGLKGPLAKLEQTIPGALQGALTGSAASKLILGNGGSSVGGAIGGAIGQKMGEKFLSAGLTKIGGKLLGSFAGPLGSVLGGVLGGAIGSLFKSVKTGYAVASNKGVQSGGSSAQLAANAKASGDNIQGALNSIADRLGATIGNYAVSIGMRSSGWIRVSASGSSDVAGKNFYKSPDAIYNGKDPEEALKVAIQNAIQDGAIQGVSAAVKKALGSSKDIDSALREAMKVADVELLIGGIGAQMEKSFRDFENQAKERLRIAKEYGFDLVKLEQRNAEDRLKLTQQLLKDQVGSLQDLVKELTSGSLFEGSAVEQRQKLLDEIATVKAKADAGDAGAADELAQLLQKLNEVSKEAYGTTGGFASDRQTILDAARDTIAKANQRVTEAQSKVDEAVADALDENNDQNDKMLGQLGINNQYLRQILAALKANGMDGLADNARTS